MALSEHPGSGPGSVAGGEPLSPAGTPFEGARIVLELEDLHTNARRHYAMTVTPARQLGLFGEGGRVVLVVAWGRIGRRPLVRRETFDTLEALGQRWRELLARRRQHGYLVSALAP